MSFCLIVSIIEGVKTLIEPKVSKIDNCFTFGDIYNKIISNINSSNIYYQRDIEIYDQTDVKSKWILIKEYFDDKIDIVFAFKFTEIKFKIILSSPASQLILQVNPLNIIMQNAH